MSSKSRFERDVFISYAHLDNETLTDEEKGWVSKFDTALQKRLAQLLGRKPDIWRDRKLQGTDIFGDEIAEHLHKLKILVSIISPRYIKSEWCRKELQEFYTLAQAKGGVRIGNKSRVVKVIKTPVPYEQHPPEISSVLGYEFYQVDDSGRFREYRLAKDSPTYYQFIERFEDVAQDICQLIKMLDEDGQPSASANVVTQAVPPETAVYLANTTSDLSEERDNIRRDLEKRGYRILPDQVLPIDGNFRETVAGYLQHCKLAIHPIGSKYGVVPEDEQRSVLEVQLELSREASLTRVIWMPPGLSSDDERQQAFISELQNHAVAQKGTELLNSKLEDLKTVIIDTLEALARPAETPQKANALPCCYLMFDETDREAVTVIEDYLCDQGLDVLKPLFEGDESDVREIHWDNLRLCDGMLIYCNQTTEAWLMKKMNDLRKAPGEGRSKPFATNAVYFTGEKESFKERCHCPGVLEIKQFADFSETDLQPFVARLTEGKGGSS